MPGLVVVGVGMSPIPVIRLLSLAGLREFMVLLVVVTQVDTPRVILVVIPVVVVLVPGIVDADLNAVVIRSGSGHNSHRRRKCSSQQKRTDVTMCNAHLEYLQENSAISAFERREVKVGFLVLPSAMIPVFPIYPFVKAS
jgi:hypothetical protein